MFDSPLGATLKNEKMSSTGGMSMTVKPYSWRLNEKIVSEIYNIADECHSKRTFMIEKALEQYVESYRLQKKASLLSQEVIDVQKSLVDLLEHRINNRSNQLLSSMAIQQFVLCKVIAESLEISPDALELYRRQAAEFLKENNRVFSLKEMI